MIEADERMLQHHSEYAANNKPYNNLRHKDQDRANTATVATKPIPSSGYTEFFSWGNDEDG